MRLFCSSCVHSISKQHVHSFPILIFPNATHCHPPLVLSLWRPTSDLCIPLEHSGQTNSSPNHHRFPPPPFFAHTHLIVIDSVFVPLCIAVASDEDTYCGTAHYYILHKLQVSHQLHRALMAGSAHWHWAKVDARSTTQDGMGHCMQTGLSLEVRRQTIGLFKGGPGGPDPIGIEGQLEREAQSCAMCLRRPSLGFTPPRGWEPGHILSHGTKRGVYVRGAGVQGRGFDGEQAMTSLYPSTDH